MQNYILLNKLINTLQFSSFPVLKNTTKKLKAICTVLVFSFPRIYNTWKRKTGKARKGNLAHAFKGK